MAFNTIDHGILLNQQVELGLKGTSLQWLYSFLANRSQAVADVGGHLLGALAITAQGATGFYSIPHVF